MSPLMGIYLIVHQIVFSDHPFCSSIFRDQALFLSEVVEGEGAVACSCEATRGEELQAHSASVSQQQRYHDNHYDEDDELKPSYTCKRLLSHQDLDLVHVGPADGLGPRPECTSGQNKVIFPIMEKLLTRPLIRQASLNLPFRCLDIYCLVFMEHQLHCLFVC